MRLTLFSNETDFTEKLTSHTPMNVLIAFQKRYQHLGLQRRNSTPWKLHSFHWMQLYP